MKFGKWKLNWKALKTKTPANAKRLGNSLVVVGLFVSGTSFALQNNKIAIAAVIATGIGKFLTEFFHDADLSVVANKPIISDQQKSSDVTPPTQG